MKGLSIFGLILFLIGFGIFNSAMFVSTHSLDDEALVSIYNPNAKKNKGNPYHAAALKKAAGDKFEKSYYSNIAFTNAFKDIFKQAQKDLETTCGYDPANKKWNCDPTLLPEGIAEWDYRMGDWKYKEYVYNITRSGTEAGLIPDNPWLFFFLTFVLCSLGGLLIFLPMAMQPAGIKHNGIYHHAATRGIKRPLKVGFLAAVGITIITLGFMGKAYMSIGKGFNLYLLIASIAVSATIGGLVWMASRKWLGRIRSASPNTNGWLSIAIGVYMIIFYVVLYFYPEYMTNWILLVDPISLALSGNPASQWFLYGFLYTLIMFVMGTRMFLKYRHNRYQLVRTGSVLFFQLGFAFLIPGILKRFNNPEVDLKNAWPLDYTFFYDYRLNEYLAEDQNSFLGMQVGVVMLVWGILLMVAIVPLFTYLYGKRWYCSWVCGCGGLAETLGDPFRQQSDKSLTAWRAERYIIHGVLVLGAIMTTLLIIGYTSMPEGVKQGDLAVLGLFKLSDLTSWYGFLISSAFAGVVGTGFYPLMGNRVWCRFGCPLAALMGLVQRFKSRFRITTNGSQCISCGNCSTYCEMGIDVRWYAQRGQDIVRSSCVGCGVCSAVCPRGVLRLENGDLDIDERASVQRTLHISKEGVYLED